MTTKQNATKPKYKNATKRKAPVTRKKRIPYGEPGGLALIPGWKPRHNEWHEHVPTEKTRGAVEIMSSFGVKQSQIAEALNIDTRTLVKHYVQELTLGPMRANVAVANNLYKIATSPEVNGAVVNAAIWWTKARMGWSEIRRTMSDVRTLSGNMRDLTDAQLLEIIEGAQTGEGGEGTFPAPSEPGQLE